MTNYLTTLFCEDNLRANDNFPGLKMTKKKGNPLPSSIFFVAAFNTFSDYLVMR